ncbi:MAG TPA: hypothetical protein VFP35_01725 [Candidatus Saccharimonadales bacterium]|nr:hypothetical protein [Candidatus Saccharimonadales bacterium]
MTINRREAITLVGLDEKVFNNFFRTAGEFSCLPRPGGRGFFKFDDGELKAWRASYDWRTVELTLDDYKLCLDFALAQHFRGYVVSDWSSARQREFGQKVTNWVKGQLGEVAFAKFIEREFGVKLELDFNIYDEIVPQDVIGVIENGQSRQPKIGIGIKASKPKSAYLVLTEDEVNLAKRRSDVYVFCRVDIPDDHLLRIARDNVIEIVKDQPHYAKYSALIPHFENIKCEIAGWCEVADLEEVTSIPGQDFSGLRLVKQSGKLNRTKADWARVLDRL